MISIESLSFSYGGHDRKPLFRDLSLNIGHGGIYGLLGRNGTGKTTLLRLMSGQLFPHGGRCTVLDRDPADRAPELLRNVFFLPEEFRVPAITGHAYVSLYAPFYPGFDSSRFTTLAMELEVDLGQRLSTLSFGQKKKFLLAFALSTGCRMLFFDEPTNGLDIPSKRQFRRTVAASLAAGQVILISTHQVRDMENLIDPIIVLEKGRIVFFHGLDVVSRALAMSHEPVPPADDAVYAEQTMGGYTVLRRRRGDATPVDLELLFNAIIQAPERVEQACAEGGR